MGPVKDLSEYMASVLKEVDARIAAGTMDLVIDHRWFGNLALNLHPEANTSQTKTMATDGTRLLYNPEYVMAQDRDVLVCTVAHEVMHCALKHPYRFGDGRNFKKWNIACDLEINPFLVESGFKLWPGALIDTVNYPLGTAAETIYARMPDLDDEGDNPGPGGNEPGNGQPDMIPPDPKDTEPDDKGNYPGMTETDWEIAADLATKIATKAGNLPGGMAKLIKESRHTPQNWREILRQFVEHTIPVDYTFNRSNRRFVATGLHLPSVRRENTPKLGVCLDTSGSISDLDIAAAGRELSEILHSSHPESIEIAYVDTEIQSTDIFTADDPEVVLNRKGYGGTAFQPGLDHFTESDDPPAAIIYISSDLECYDVPTDPGIPVLWVTTPASAGRRFGFGETVVMENYS